MFYIGRIYVIKVKDEFKNSMNILSLDQLKYIQYQYIGSTKLSLKERYKHHKSQFNQCKTRELIELFGELNLEIILVKEYQIVDEKHLFMYETLYMNKLRYQKINILNGQMSFRVDRFAEKDYRIKNKNIKKIVNVNYYEANKEYFKKHNSDYYIHHKQNFKCE